MKSSQRSKSEYLPRFPRLQRLRQRREQEELEFRTYPESEVVIHVKPLMKSRLH